ncbi:survival of motor neuron protein isoform X2 [Microcaecilia unicolor]|uniref:Survival of motor neuron protein-like isoform X2 n=1 Tax=Microcaecilia unicolor TaxID=1415580 RepID=A0A6P7ZJJ8_9AMPH|nr:survival of motor neuron protein-like isoform X2 [Microcaecilia unicolor]
MLGWAVAHRPGWGLLTSCLLWPWAFKGVAMAACDGEVVYQKESSQSEDIDEWDDAALIKSYEKAVKSFQDILRCNDKKRDAEGPVAPTALQPSRQREEGGDKKKKSSQQNSKWKVGDDCRAVWSEDGLVYPARIHSLDEEEGSCLLVYEGYGNEEEHSLTDLLPPSPSAEENLKSRRRWKVGDSCTVVWSEDGCVYPAKVKSIDLEAGTCMVEYDGYGNMEKHHLEEIVSVGSSNDSSSSSSSSGTRRWKVGDRCSAVWAEDGQVYPAVVKSVNSATGTCIIVYEGYENEEQQNLADLRPPNRGTVDTRAGKPNCFWPPPPPSVRAHMPTWHNWPPSAPLPPPPPFFSTEWEEYDEEEEEPDEDALACMLMAWYMTGYHTGFYMGLKQGRAEALRTTCKKGSRRK